MTTKIIFNEPHDENDDASCYSHCLTVESFKYSDLDFFYNLLKRRLIRELLISFEND